MCANLKIIKWPKMLITLFDTERSEAKPSKFIGIGRKSDLTLSWLYVLLATKMKILTDNILNSSILRRKLLRNLKKNFNFNRKLKKMKNQTFLNSY